MAEKETNSEAGRLQLMIILSSINLSIIFLIND